MGSGARFCGEDEVSLLTHGLKLCLNLTWLALLLSSPQTGVSLQGLPDATTGRVVACGGQILDDSFYARVATAKTAFQLLFIYFAVQHTSFHFCLIPLNTS